MVLPAKTHRSTFDRERWITGAAVLLVVLLLLVIVALPVGALVGQSFFDREGAFVGLANFARYFENPALVQSAFNSVGLAAISAVICTAVAYVYAYGLTLSCMPAKGVLRAGAGPARRSHHGRSRLWPAVALDEIGRAHV